MTDKPIIPLYSIARGDRPQSPFRLVEMTPRKEGTYDYSRPHRHDYYEIFWFEAGEGEHDLDFTTYPITPPSLHFVSPGQVHQVRRSNDSWGCVILFSDEFYSLGTSDRDILHDVPMLHTLLGGSHPHPLLNLDESEAAAMAATIGRMRAELEMESAYRDDALRSHLNLLLIATCRLLEKRDGGMTEETKEKSLVRRLRALVERNFHAIHAVTAYANSLSVTPGHLNEVTKSVTGKTVSGLIQERIILEAKRLLAHSDRSVKEIAYALGFDDPSYFTRFFRERAGAAPLAFRERHQRGDVME